MIERGHVCMLPSRARITSDEFKALRVIESAREPTIAKLPDFRGEYLTPGIALGSGDKARALIDGKWCLLTVQFHFGCKQVYAERITIMAKEQAA